MKKLTNDFGNVVADNQNSLTAGAQGPLLLQDYILLEKLAHQNRERIPERTVHAKGGAAYGELVITGDISQYTKAKVLQKGEKTPLLLRFSTVAGESGAADAERDLRLNSTQEKAIGIWLETILQRFLSVILISFQTLFILKSAIQEHTCGAIMLHGTFGVFVQRACTKLLSL